MTLDLSIVLSFYKHFSKKLVIFPSRSTKVVTQLSSFENAGLVNQINNFQRDQQLFFC